MANPSGAKGTFVETAVVNYLVDHGFPHAEKRRPVGQFDKGDVAGTIGLCWEAKFGDRGLKLSEWMRETRTEQANARADYGILVVKPKGLGEKRVDQWIAAMHHGPFTELYEQAGIQAERMLHLHISGSRINGPGVAAVSVIDKEHKATGTFGYVKIQPVIVRGELRPAVAMTTLEQITKLVRMAGYGDPVLALSA